jgi:hypothetical protein
MILYAVSCIEKFVNICVILFFFEITTVIEQSLHNLLGVIHKFDSILFDIERIVENNQ